MLNVVIPVKIQPMRDAARQLGLPVDEADNGYLVHCALTAAWGDNAPSPFLVADYVANRFLVHAYFDGNETDLADSYTHTDSVNFERVRGCSISMDWTRGQVVGFQVLCCPVIRKSGSGREMDAYLADDTGRDRAAVYREWLSADVARRGAAEVIDCQVDHWKLTQLLRRTQGNDRKASLITRPAAVMSGRMKVREPARMEPFLLRGVGRHRAFGFGMMRSNDADTE